MSKTTARTVTLDPILMALVCLGLAIAVVTLSLSSPLSDRSVQELKIVK